MRQNIFLRNSQPIIFWLRELLQIKGGYLKTSSLSPIPRAALNYVKRLWYKNHLKHSVDAFFIGTSLKLVFITYCIIDKTISIKYFLLTNHDP